MLEYERFWNQSAYSPKFWYWSLVDTWQMKPYQAYTATGLSEKGVGWLSGYRNGQNVYRIGYCRQLFARPNKRVLILTPIAVAFQFLKEAENLELMTLATSKGELQSKIVVCNYERIQY